MAQKKYEDYLERIYSKFPDIDQKSIDNIIEHGLKRIHYFAKRCQDIYIRSDNNDLPFYMYIGFKDQNKSLDQFCRSKRAQHRKIRILFKEKKIPFEEFSYFGLTNEEFEEFNKNGLIPRIIIYKILEESYIRSNVSHIFKTKIEFGEMETWFAVRHNFERINAEYILKREGLEFLPVI